MRSISGILSPCLTIIKLLIKLYQLPAERSIAVYGHGGIHLLVSHHRWWWWWSIGWLCSSCKYIVNQHYNIIIIIDNALWNADRRSNRSPHSFPCDIILMSPHWHSQQKRKKTEPSSSSRRRRRQEEQSSQAHGGSQFTVIWRDQFVDPRSLARSPLSLMLLRIAGYTELDWTAGGPSICFIVVIVHLLM